MPKFISILPLLSTQNHIPSNGNSNSHPLSSLFLQIHTIGAKIPVVIVFGDSSVDAGNNNHLRTVLTSNFQPYGRDFSSRKATGRLSNGRVPSDFISEAFGLPPYVPTYLDPVYNITDFATGVCFASAGTTSDNSTSDVFNLPFSNLGFCFCSWVFKKWQKWRSFI